MEYKAKCPACGRESILVVHADDGSESKRHSCSNKDCRATITYVRCMDVGNGVDDVAHPKHYTSSPARCQCGAAIECIQITEHMNFNLGNAVKYIWRHEGKGGIKDLRKAAWYINREIERVTK